MTERSATIYYDEDCGFCRRMTRIVLHIDHKRGRHLVPKQLQHPEAATDLHPLSGEQRMASWHLRSSDGRVFSGGEAFAELARTWRLSSGIVRALEANQPGINRAYDWVARNRVGFGRATRWMPDLPAAAKENPPA